MMKCQLDFVVFTFVLLFYRSVSGLCPYRCQCDEERLTAICDDAKLDVVPITLNPDLRELHLEKNSIKGIMSAFNVYRNLEYLDMSGNQLVTLGRNNFERQQKLQILLLGYNMISSLQRMTFFGLNSLHILKLTGNFIQQLPEQVFSELSSLEVLDLSENSISTISNHAFIGLARIKILLLRENKVMQIPKAAFGPLPHLISLDLGLNSFPLVEDYVFSNLLGLETLKLDSCGIREIRKHAFSALKHLTDLLLQDNLLNVIPTEAFRYLKSVRELQIGQNNFRKIQANAFTGLMNLRSLVINSAPLLKRIENDAFSRNDNLQHIAMNHNKKLSYIGKDAFTSLPFLRTVSLRDNAFHTIPAEILPWQNLEHFDIRDNPLVCNCSISWLLRLLQNFNYSNHVDPDVTLITCETPPLLRDILLKDLTPEDLGCYISEMQKIMTWTFATVGILIIVLIVIVLWYRQKVANDLKIKCSTSLSESQFDTRYGQETLRQGLTPEREWIVKIGREPYPGRLV